MPAPARKSSIGSRRPPQRYIPYRADDFQHGKKTGIAVAYVDHKSDEFEPFDKVMSQADARTPPRVQNARKKRTPKPKTPIIEQYEDDENGEMSMELEDSIPNSPSAYFAHTRVNTITSSARRVGSSSRPVAQSSDVDFDKVPSPRDSSPIITGRRSIGLPRSPGPSRLSQSFAARDDHDNGPEDDGGMDYDGGGLDFEAGGFDSDDDDDVAPAHSSRQEQQHSKRLHGQPVRRTSFTQMDREDEEEEEQVEELAAGPPSDKSRGKQRANGFVPYRDPELEDEIAQGFEEVDQGPVDEHMDDGEEQEEEQRPRKRGAKERGDDDSVDKHQPSSKKARTENEGAKKPPGRPRGKKNNVLREVTPDENTDGLRRGKRTRYKPLEWWRCEKVVYGRREGGISLVPTIKEIVRLPKEEPQPLGAKHRRKRPPRSKSKTLEVEAELVLNPEEGWDDETEIEGTVINIDSGEELRKRIAFTAKMVSPRAAANNDFFFQKIFGEGDFIAAGQLMIPPGGQKPTKSSKDNTYVFYVIEGAVNFKLHRNNYVIATGGMFLVPRGNFYFIQNICEREARLFFAQAREMREGEDDDEEEGRRSSSRRLSAGLLGHSSRSKS